MIFIRKSWTFSRHICLSLILSGIIKTIKSFLGVGHPHASIGIIGGADGPTAILISSNALNGSTFRWFYGMISPEIIFFIFCLLSYRPLKYLLRKKH